MGESPKHNHKLKKTATTRYILNINVPNYDSLEMYNYRARK